MTDGSLLEKFTKAESFLDKKRISQTFCLTYSMVREKGLEPSRPKALVPKTSASTNSATRAWNENYCSMNCAKTLDLTWRNSLKALYDIAQQGNRGIS